jgi:hypothetical protein
MSAAGVPTRSVCSAHALLMGDQKSLHRLLFVRSIAQQLRREEWSRLDQESANSTREDVGFRIAPA